MSSIQIDSDSLKRLKEKLCKVNHLLDKDPAYDNVTAKNGFDYILEKHRNANLRNCGKDANLVKLSFNKTFSTLSEFFLQIHIKKYANVA